MNRKIYRLAGLFAIVGLLSFIAKDDLTARLKQYLQTYRVNYAPEAVYVQTDKPYYVAGETIWLKAYLTDAATHRPTSQSGVLYVDLLGEKGQAAQRLKLNVKDGEAKGNFDLTDSLAAGNYRLTAYTNWMRNFGEETFFNRPIRIWQGSNNSSTVAEQASANKKATHKANAVSPVDLQFFPEGGNMVADIPAKVAFKAINQEGMGVPAKGFIIDAQGKKIMEFQSFHIGMGAFIITPETNMQYTARLVKADGAVQDFPLPKVQAQGYALSVDEYGTPGAIAVHVQGNKELQGTPLVLTAISQDDLVYTENVTLSNSKADIDIEKSKLPTGIIRFTLSDRQGEPFAERLAYIRPENQLHLSMRVNEQEYLPREQVRMSIEAKDTQGNPVAANLSLAVTDQDMVTPVQNDQNIASYLLLTSDLKGYVEQPAYYFQNVDNTTKQALQYVMMTHGWRHFTWKEAVSGQYPTMQYPREQDLSITGKLVNKKSEPVKNGEMILYVQDKYQTFIVQNTDDQGRFAFDGFDFTDSVDLTIQGTTENSKRNTAVRIDQNNYVPDAPDWHVPMASQLLASAHAGYVDFSTQRIATEDAYQPQLRDMVLKEITVEDRVNIVEPMRLHSRADQVLQAKDLVLPPPSGNILESLQGRVAGLRIYRTGWNDFGATIRGMGEPLYLLDGVPISSNTVSAVSPWDIDHIEILKGPEAAIYGGRASGGVIAFYTKRGEVEYEEVKPGPYIISFRAGGYTKAREFYAPKYTASNVDQKKPDLRTTIHWAPNIQTGADGKAEVTFYAADRAATYRATLEGLTSNGLPGSQIYTFDVVKPNSDEVGR